MTKKEIIWRYILNEALNKGIYQFVQKEIAVKFGFSTCTVFNALKIPRKSGVVEVTGRNFRLRDKEKLLLIWATQRNLQRDIVYAAHVDMPVLEIESSVPPDSIFGAFSAYRIKYNEAPADYAIVYIYSKNLEEIKKRFPFQKGYKNLFVLKPDLFLGHFGKLTPAVQTFVDLWNIPQWYAKDFSEALKKKLNI